jgi:hypothetical protein
MKKLSQNVIRAVAVLLVVFSLSACELGDRREGSTNQPTQPANLPSQSAPKEETPASSTPEDAGSAEDLLNLISTLEAENNTGDALEDLP